MIRNLTGALFGLLMGLVISCVFLLLLGFNMEAIFAGFRGVLKGSLGDATAISSTIIKMTAYLIGALAIIISYRAGIFNIGLEGQIYMGAIGAALIALKLTFLPGIVGVLLAVLLAMIFASFYAFIPAMFKVKYNISEIVVTLLLNYIAFYFVKILISSGADGKNRGFLQSGDTYENESSFILDKFHIPEINIFGVDVSIVFFIGIVLAILMYMFIYKRQGGYKLVASGSNPIAASYIGINVDRVRIKSMLVSGALAGIIGWFLLLGEHHRLIGGFVGVLGFTAIAVALLAKLQPLVVIPSALFFAILETGSESMKIDSRFIMSFYYGEDISIPSVFVELIKGVIIISILIGSSFKFKNIKKIKRKKEEKV